MLGWRNGSAAGGHLLEAYVRVTLEVVLTESPAPLRKPYGPESGLALIDLRPALTPYGWIRPRRIA